MSKNRSNPVTREDFAELRKDFASMREDVASLSTTVDQTSRATAQLLVHVGKLRGEMYEGFEALREEMRAGDEALREEMRAGDEALREEMRAGDEALREEMRAGDEALRGEMRVEMRAGDKALREEMREGFAAQAARLDALTSEQRALANALSRMAEEWASAKEAAQRTAHRLGHESVWDWVPVADGRIRMTEARLGRLERGDEAAT